MKTVITLTIVHSKPLPDITDVICQRVWPYGGGCITDMTAAIQEDRTGWPAGLLQDDDRKLSKALAATPHARRLAEEACEEIIRADEAQYAQPKKPGFWGWVWGTQA